MAQVPADGVAARMIFFRELKELKGVITPLRFVRS